MRTITFLAILICLAGANSSAGTPTWQVPADSAWPMFRHDPYHTGLSPIAGDMDTCLLLWMYETAYDTHNLTWVSSSTVLGDIDADGKLEVVLGAWDDFVHALNGEDGSVLWTYEGPHDFLSTPALADIDEDGILEVVSGGHLGVYALNGEDGSLLWLTTLGASSIASSPVVGDLDGDGGPEVAIGYGSGVCALSGADGNLLWSYPTGGWNISSPALGDIDRDGLPEVIVGGGYSKKVYALNGEDGSLLWSYETGSIVYSSPAVGDIDGDGKLEVVVGSRDFRVYALNGEDGSLLWSYATGGQVWSSAGLGDIDGDGKLEVVVGSRDHNIYALNGEDGSVLWSYKTGWMVDSTPALGDVDGDGNLEVVVGSFDCNLYALNGEDGSVQWSFETIGRAQWSPSLGDIDLDGRLEVIYNGRDRMVYALDGPAACEPMCLKQSVVAELDTLEPESERGAKRIKKAKKHIEKSLEEKRWIDDTHLRHKHGKKVFDEEKKAVKDIRKLCKKGEFPGELCERLIGMLVEADSILARVAIDDAKAANGKEKEIKKAEKEMAKAEEDKNKGKYDKTIDHYKKAWEHAQKAMKKHKKENQMMEYTRSESGTVLLQNRPNPVISSTRFEFVLEHAAEARLTVHDVAGREVWEVAPSPFTEGQHSLEWNCLDQNGVRVPSGIYIYKLETESFSQTRKMVIIR